MSTDSFGKAHPEGMELDRTRRFIANFTASWAWCRYDSIYTSWFFFYNIYTINHDLLYVYYMWLLCKNLTIYILCGFIFYSIHTIC
jgi:hypothetical protein